MGATEKGGQKSRKLFSLRRPWKATRRLWRQRSARQAGQGECGRGRSGPVTLRQGAAAAGRSPAVSLAAFPAPGAWMPRRPLNPTLGRGDGDRWGSAAFCLGTVSFPLAPTRCFGSGHREATVARRHSLTEVSLSPPHTWPGACNAVPFGGMNPNPSVPLRSSRPVPTAFLPACGDLEALATINYFLAHSVLSSPGPQLTANH
ncbi:hypothetical protein H8958_006156 [Nasalis larvatus]